MKRMTNWEILCNLMKGHTYEKIYRFQDEHDMESHFYDYLQTIFHWDKELIGRQISTPVGNRQRARLDLAITNGRDGDAQEVKFIIELKKPSVAIAKDEINEICSYMDVFRSGFGVITNGAILLLVYSPKNNRERSRVIFQTSYNPENKDAIALCNLLDGSVFQEEAMEKFCEELITRNPSASIGDSFIGQQMSDELDQKIVTLISSYADWLSNNDKEKEYLEKYTFGMQRVRETVLDNNLVTQLLRRESSETFVKDIKDWLPNLKGLTSFHFNSAIVENRAIFVESLKHLIKANKSDRFKIIEDFVGDGRWRVSGLGRAFWSEIIRCKFPDVPLVNAKTDDFFMAIGIQTGTNPEDKCQNIAYCYKRWNEKWNEKSNDKKLSMLQLSHMEHYAKTNEEGSKLVEMLFHTKIGDEFEKEENN